MNTKFGRRSFLAAAAALASAAGLPRGLHAAPNGRQPLRIPTLLDARSLGQSLALEAREGATEFFPGVATPTLGYNQDYLGPTLRLHAGDDVEVTVANRMQQATTVHWHGLLVPGELDGGPHQGIEPGATWRPVLRVRQRAASLWYHSHAHGASAQQVYFGLAGMLIVRDDAEAALGLPSEYGVDDLPVIVQDRHFAGGHLFLPSTALPLQGASGDTLLANGTPDALARVPARRVRLRLVNASNARRFVLAFDDDRPFHWIAGDGGLLAAPIERRSLALSPGERAEVVVDFSGGAGATLIARGDPEAQWFGSASLGLVARRTQVRNLWTRPVVTFEVGAPTGPAKPLPERLAALEEWDASHAVRERRFTLEMGMGAMGAMHGMAGIDRLAINGRPYDMARIDERVRLGDLEIWEVASDSMPHPFHVHGVHFRVMDAPEAGFKDTVRVRAPVRLLVRFTQPAIAAPFMYHCHILEHADRGMMGQFTVS